MKRIVVLPIVFFYGFCLLLSAQRRDDPVEVKIAGMEATPVGVSITLQASGSGDTIHMMIGFIEGQSVARAVQHEKSDRPGSNDVFKSFLDRNGWRVKKVLIKDIKQGNYLADLTIENDSETQVYDTRPSDAMAMGLRYGAKIYVNERVFEEERQGTGGDQDKDKDQDQDSSHPDQLKL